MKKNTIRKKADRTVSRYSTASMIGLHLVSAPIVGVGLGWLADNFFNSTPYGISIGLILGFVSGFLNVKADTKKLKHEAEKHEQQKVEQEIERIYREQNPHEFIEYGLFGDEKKKDLSKTNE